MSAAPRPPTGPRSAAGPRRPARPPGGRETIAVTPVAVLVSIVCVIIGLLSVGAGGDPASGRGDGAIVEATVSATPGRAIPPGYLGLSLETSAIESYAGTDPAAPDPLFLRLVRALTPGASPVIRIGGDTADWSWWPVSGLSRPPGVYITLDQTWVGVTDAIARSLGARLILGLNLEADSAAIAATEAANMRAGIPDSRILAFELGNEPSIYGQYPWYRTPSGKGVNGRPANWNFARYLADFDRIAPSVAVPAFAGPSVGGPGWFPELPRLLAAEPRVRVLTVHQYPFQLCRTAPTSPRYPTIAHLLDIAGTNRFVTEFAAPVATAHARGLPLRIDELNSVSCGADTAVSQTFASALWAIDMLFALARTGADGVQIHTFPGAGYELFHFRRSSAGTTVTVAPEYYGLLMFAAAAPAGSRLLSVRAPADPRLALWATRGRDGRTRVLLVNTDAAQARTAGLRVPGVRTGAPATVALLRAPSLSSSSGVTIAGRSFGSATRTGHLVGRRAASAVPGHDGRWVVTVPAGSAALVTLG